MSISTKTGDAGESSLLDGTRVPKNDSRMEAYGTVDELNAAIAVCYNHVDEQTKVLLEKVQNHLFVIGAELASLPNPVKGIGPLTHAHIAFLDSAIADLESNLEKQQGFILPQGNPAAATLHLARTICRRAERRVVFCAPHEPSPEILKYLNRLSDLLFLCARKHSQDKPVSYE